MTRVTPAANQLIAQVQKLNPKFKAVPTGEPDGLGVHRSLELDAATSKVVVPILEVIADKRIESIAYEGKGRAVVTFVADSRADFKDDYPLKSVGDILYEKPAKVEKKPSEPPEEDAQ